MIQTRSNPQNILQVGARYYFKSAAGLDALGFFKKMAEIHGQLLINILCGFASQTQLRGNPAHGCNHIPNMLPQFDAKFSGSLLHSGSIGSGSKGFILPLFLDR
jgi:hypothetical protein